MFWDFKSDREDVLTQAWGKKTAELLDLGGKYWSFSLVHLAIQGNFGAGV